MARRRTPPRSIVPRSDPVCCDTHRLTRVATLAALSACLSASLAVAASGTGGAQIRIELREPSGAPAPAEDGVVWLPGVRAAGAAATGSRRIAQREKRFEPHVEVTRVGTSVTFPNFDRIYHNVFSLSEIARFDLGLYRNGASKTVTFVAPGIVRIYCNIHPQMAAFLLVVDSDFFAKTSKAGVADLAGVPEGTWPVKVWHERGGEWLGSVIVRPDETTRLRVTLDGSQWRPLTHKNKYGKDYLPPDDDETRY